MKIVISIPIHEKIEVVIDQIKNIQYFVQNPIIVLHISKDFYEERAGNFAELTTLKNVYVNPIHYDVGWGNIAHVHLSNFRYAVEQIGQFDYFIPHASNDMYVRKGIEDYIINYDAGISRRLLDYPKSMWCPCQIAHEDEILQEIMRENQIAQIAATQIEGSFYTKPVFQMIADCIADRDISQGRNYTKEEIYFSTIVYAKIPQERLGYPTTYSEVHQYDRGLWKRQRLAHSIAVLPIISPFVQEKDMQENIEEWYHRKGHYRINRKIVDRIRNGDKRYVLRNSRLNDYSGIARLYDGTVFSVKRVAREYKDKVRTYIRGLMNENIVS